MFNPAFDVTPHKLISAIVTEAGIISPPSKQILRKYSLNMPNLKSIGEFGLIELFKKRDQNLSSILGDCGDDAAVVKS